MNSLTEDLWAIILARLPLKSITNSKLVCKKWKSVVESPFLRDLFVSRHQNSHSSWSLMCRESKKEVVSHYGCEIWGLPRSLGSYISSFLTEQFKTQKDEHTPVWLPKQKVRVVAYTDVGLILIKLKSISGNLTYYVANPISRQCVEIPPLPPLPPSVESFELSGLVTWIESSVVLVGYKVVLMDHTSDIETNVLRLLIYSSETGLWSFNTLHSPLPLQPLVKLNPVSLNGSLYWLGYRVVVSHDFYATGTESDRCRVIPFPDSEKQPNFRRACTISQGFLMYMNIVSEEIDDGRLREHKLTVWTLKSREWQLLSEISPACIKTGFDYFPLEINPFDGNIMYLRSKMHKCLASTNLHKGKFGLHNNLERSSDGRTLSFAGDWDPKEAEPFFSTFVLPRWLYRIPSPPS